MINLIPHYLLLATCYWLLSTYYLLLTVDYSLLTTYHLLPTRLKIEEQLLNITMATGEAAVQTEGEGLAHMASEDLEWSLGAHLCSGALY